MNPMHNTPEAMRSSLYLCYKNKEACGASERIARRAVCVVIPGYEPDAATANVMAALAHKVMFS